MAERIDDPAPNPVDVHVEKLGQIVGGVTAASKEKLRSVREKLDSTLRAIDSRHDSVMREIESFAEIARHMANNIPIMEDVLDKLTLEFKVQLPTAPQLVDDKQKDKQKAVDTKLKEKENPFASRVHIENIAAHFGPDRPLGERK